MSALSLPRYFLTHKPILGSLNLWLIMLKGYNWFDTGFGAKKTFFFFLWFGQHGLVKSDYIKKMCIIVACFAKNRFKTLNGLYLQFAVSFHNSNSMFTINKIICVTPSNDRGFRFNLLKDINCSWWRILTTKKTNKKQSTCVYLNNCYSRLVQSILCGDAFLGIGLDTLVPVKKKKTFSISGNFGLFNSSDFTETT